MAETNQRQERELVLAPNEYAQISDETKGDITSYVGPNTTSLAATARPVIFNPKTKRFDRVDLSAAIQTQVIAPEGWYVVLKNPAVGAEHPLPASRATTPTLSTGRKINIPGPTGFALWPGQMAKVLQGHHIRSNQYLIGRVYDERAANENWGKAVLKVATKHATDTGSTPDDSKKIEAETDARALIADRPELQMGTLLVIRGTDVSFFIPPTGIEVVADDAGKLVREAVTLERLEYCLLLDQDGNKRYVQGPDVVFPKPTEVFVMRNVKDRATGEEKPTRKFKAVELSETSGIYVRVIADYGENGKEYKVGDELFITGKDQMIYFQRQEHAVVKYGDQEVHYAIAIPAGEARYVLDRQKGNVDLVRGPKMFLPDPRSQVITRRILDMKMCALLYPGNVEALSINQNLLGLYNDEVATEGAMMANAGMVQNQSLEAHYRGRTGAVMYASATLGDSAAARGLGGRAARGVAGDAIDRKNQFVEPRTITLRTKYEGAVTVSLWTGYAMLFVSKSGQRRVVEGPQTALLEYDEEPQLLEMSTGKPKSTDKLEQTYYLRVHANKVGDIIDVQTKDLCDFKIKLSYRVNFTGDPSKWFNVENYVKFLCDNMRSRIKNKVLQFSVQDFFTQGIPIIREIVLGPAKTDGTSRDGTVFKENGMHIYDVEVLMNELQDARVKATLVEAERESLSQSLVLASQSRTLDFTKESERMQQETLQAKAETTFKQCDLAVLTLEKQLEVDLEKLNIQHQVSTSAQAGALEDQKARGLVETEKLKTIRAQREQELAIDDAILAQKLKERRAEVEAIIDRAKAITPGLIEALNSFGENAMIEKVSQAMAPLSIIGGTSVMDAIKKLLEGTKLGQQLSNTINNNGKADHRALPPTA